MRRSRGETDESEEAAEKNRALYLMSADPR